MSEHDIEGQPDRSDRDGGAVSGDVLHGGEGDPLGGGVADLEPSEEVTEGIPNQGDEPGS